jgi:ubiquinone/menaquinone biosynthesis C-methylase UbiE
VSGDVEFDHIAPIYDETRRPPTDGELEALVGLLTECHTILDVGVGTGRFAAPLGQRGLEILGVDLSLEMMRRARTKGIGTLIRADLRRLPVSGEAVDGAFMAHVLQLVPDPGPVLRELGRVARRAVVILLPEWSEQLRTGAGRERRERYRELAAELGYPLPKRGKRYQHTIEELSAIAPPRAIREVSGPPPGPNGEERMARWSRMLSGGGQLPPEVHTEIVRRLQLERPIDPATGARDRSSRFVAWDPRDLRSMT